MSDFKIVSLLNPPVQLNSGVMGISAGTSIQTTGTISFANSNGVSFGLSAGTLTASAVAGGGGGVAIEAGTNSTSTGTVSFLNSNGVSFGMNTNGAITATVKTDYQTSGNYLTTAMASNRGSDFVQANAAFAGTNASGTIASNGISVSVAAPVTTDGLISGINVSAGTTSNNLSAFTFGNGNGLTFGLNASTITASVKTDYLTTARASTDAIGLNTAQSNVTWTVNSSGLSLDARGYAGTATGATNASVTANSGGISVSVAAPVTTNGLISGVNFSAGTTSNNSTAIKFADSNGVSFGLNAGTITATVKTDYLTTARASTDAVGLNTALTGNGVAWTVNSSGISLNVPAFLTTAMASNAATISNVRVSAGTTSNLLSALTFADSNGVSFGLNAGTLTATVKTDYLTTAALSNHSHGNPQLNLTNLSGTTASNSAGFTLSLSAGNYLTTARASNDAIGLNTALTANGVSVTANSSGLSLNFPAFLTTAMASNRGSDFVQATAAFAGTNASGTIASNGISVSVAAPGAAAENNWVNLLGANTAGNTTASGSTLGFSGGNGVTLSGTNGSQIVFSVSTYDTIGTATTGYPVASANSVGTVSRWAAEDHRHAGIGAMGISTAGNTAGTTGSVQGTYWLQGGNNITVSQITSNNGSHTLVLSGANGGGGGVTLSYFNPQDGYIQVTGQYGNSSVMIQPAQFPDVQFDRICLPMAYSNASNSSNSGTVSVSWGMYTRNGSTLSQLFSTSTSWNVTNSGTVGSYSLYGGVRLATIPFTTTLTAGQYWVGQVSVSTTGGGAGMTFWNLAASQQNSSFSGIVGAATNATVQYTRGLGKYTANSTALPTAIQFSEIQGNSSNFLRQPLFYVVSGTF